MATKYCRAAGGNWNTNATWSTTSSAGAANTTKPTAADDVIIDAGSATGAPLVIDAASVCRSINCTGFVNTITHNAFTLTIGDGTAGTGNVALLFVSGMTYTLANANTSAISFISSSSTQQSITTGGKTLGNITVNNASSNYQLQDALTSSGNFTYTAGTTFDTNGKIMTFNGASVTFAGGGKTFYEVDLTGSGNVTVSGANTFTNFNRTAVAGSSLTFSANQTISGNFTLAGVDAITRLVILSSTLGTQITITNTGATQIWSYVDFQDIGLTTLYDASAITGNSGDRQGNSNITFTPSATLYWFRDTGNWSDSTKWFTSTGGVGAGRVPLPQDDVIFDDTSTTGAGKTITMDRSVLGRNINFSALPSNTNLTKSISVTLWGSLTLSNKITTLTSSNNITFQGRTACTMTTAGRFWFANGDGSIIISTFGGSLTLLDALSLTAGGGGNRVINLTDGTFNTNGFSVGTDSFTSTGSATRALITGASQINVKRTSGTVWNVSSSLSLTPGTGEILISNTGATTKTFTGGGLTYYNLRISTGASSIVVIQNSNTFNKLSATGGTATTVNFTAGTTTILTGDERAFFTGAASNLITCQSTSGGNAWNLVKASDYIASDYLSLQDSHASGGATFYAGSHSTNVSGNTGWTFSMASFAEAISLTIISLISELDILFFPENLSVTLQTNITLTDIQHYIESLNNISQLLVSFQDIQASIESLLYNSVLSNSLTDIQSYIELLSYTKFLQTTLQDVQSYIEICLITQNLITTLSDTELYVENLNVIQELLVNLNDLQNYTENLNTLIIELNNSEEFQAYSESLNELIISDISISDIQNFREQLNITIQSIFSLLSRENSNFPKIIGNLKRKNYSIIDLDGNSLPTKGNLTSQNLKKVLSNFNTNIKGRLKIRK